MTILPRKLTFQLTPLLDLLLIVIFAQYMEVQETASQNQAEVRQRAEAQLAVQELRHAEKLAELGEEQQQVRQQQAGLDEARQKFVQRERDIRDALRVVLERQREVGDIVAQLFQVPEELVDDLLNPRDLGAHARSDEELAELRTAFRDLAKLRGTEAMKHLLTYQELRKRCDIWEIYISQQGLVTVDAAAQSKRFRFRRLEDSALRQTGEEIEQKNRDAAERFADYIFEFYKTLPQTKGVVIILLSYDEQTNYHWRRPALVGLSLAADRMRADSNGRTRFEYAVIGPIDKNTMQGTVDANATQTGSDTTVP